MLNSLNTSGMNKFLNNTIEIIIKTVVISVFLITFSSFLSQTIVLSFLKTRLNISHGIIKNIYQNGKLLFIKS